jgi:uncharacterized lipoprotein
MRRLALLLALLLPACALQPDHIEVRHQPQVMPAAMPGAELIALSVVTQDNRQIRDRVGNKVNGYGMEMAPIIATNDVVAELRQAIVRELEARGFRTNGTDGRVEIEVLRFLNRFLVGFWTGTAQGELTANVRVLSPGGQILFTKNYTVEAQNPGIMLASGENAQIALEEGLRRLVRAIGDDQDLLRVLGALGGGGRPVS